MTRERAEELLAEKGMMLIRRTRYAPSGEEIIEAVVIDPAKADPIAVAAHWRAAVSDALGIPAF